MTPKLLAEIRARVVRNYNDGTSDVYEQVGCDRRDLLEYVTELLWAQKHQPHWTCKTHGDFDANVAVGCPECVRALRAKVSV